MLCERCRRLAIKNQKMCEKCSREQLGFSLHVVQRSSGPRQDGYYSFPLGDRFNVEAVNLHERRVTSLIEVASCPRASDAKLIAKLLNANEGLRIDPTLEDPPYMGQST